ncbi:hypothetical protein BD413DRAFT_476421 [Trametes elegans]|nr:hypothetical protein BD413DRAFT_476421 [Trametes elegans]
MLAPILQLATLVLASFASPLPLSPHDVIVAPITQPAAGTVRKTGETQTVTPGILTNPVGQIILGTLTEDGNQHLLMGTCPAQLSPRPPPESPLASDSSLFGGSASLTVPVVPTGDDYIVGLFGTSGDISAKFCIVDDDGSS